MKPLLEPELMGSRSTSAVCGWLSGIAMSALRQVPFVVSTDGAPDTDMLVVDELAVGALGGVVHELELVSHAIGRQATASGQRT